jgi:hypothetical protein
MYRGVSFSANISLILLFYGFSQFGYFLLAAVTSLPKSVIFLGLAVGFV